LEIRKKTVINSIYRIKLWENKNKIHKKMTHMFKRVRSMAFRNRVDKFAKKSLNRPGEVKMARC